MLGVVAVEKACLEANTASLVRNSVEILPEISAIVEGELVKHSQLRVRALAFQRAMSIMMHALGRWTAERSCSLFE